jgi:hypothetical protein
MVYTKRRRGVGCGLKAQPSRLLLNQYVPYRQQTVMLIKQYTIHRFLILSVRRILPGIKYGSQNIIIVQVQQQWHQGMCCTSTIRTTDKSTNNITT